MIIQKLVEVNGKNAEISQIKFSQNLNHLNLNQNSLIILIMRVL